MSKHRSCVVTGGLGGIGSAIVTDLRQQGWHVIALDSSPSQYSAADLTVVHGDVADPQSHEQAAHLAIAAAPLRAWVNCAGYNVLGSVADLPPDALDRGISVNLTGVFHGTAAAVRAALQQPDDARACSIVNISSIHGHVGFPGFAAYAMCKGGMEALTRQVAAEYLGSGIRCNAVAPGLIESPMNDTLLAEAKNKDELQNAWNALTPIGRWGRAEEIARLVVFLAEERTSGFITGQTILADGGASILARGQQPWTERSTP